MYMKNYKMMIILLFLSQVKVKVEGLEIVFCCLIVERNYVFDKLDCFDKYILIIFII